ncbi:FkbM family methyltransferase [Mucisphaera sp.]|uniref:FkbM family methyltransferase n=1 Tax=Mucisphaera sp. TaxID=2913024 RepID=UPI003D0C57E3
MIQSLIDRFRPVSRPAQLDCATPEEVEAAEFAFYKAFLKPCMTAFDVGANRGEVTRRFAKLVGTGGYVHAFEPCAATYQRLRQRFDGPPVQLHHMAIGETVGQAKLNVYDEEHDTWNTLANRPLEDYGINVRPQSIEEVPVTTLDRFCEEHDIQRIDLLKIDIEGAELQALRGARGLMQEKRIGVILFEFGQTTFDMGNTPDEFISLLDDCGYQLGNLVNNDPVFPGGESAKTAQFSMMVAGPR